MGIENVVDQRPLDDPARMGGEVADAPVAKKPAKKGASDEMVKLHGRLMDWYNTERDLQALNRAQMATDEDFFDGLQWEPEDIEELALRGQAPLVFNHIKPTINWLLGTERRTRTDGKVLPRSDDDEEGAEVKSKLLKYLSDVNRLPFERSAAWEDCVIAGVGWLEDGISTDPEDELLNSRSESWRNVWYDSQSKDKDHNQDGRYLFRRKDIDLDYAISMCPEYEAELRGMSIDAEQMAADDNADFYLGKRTGAEDNGDYGRASRLSSFNSATSVEMRRVRVRLIECWYKMPENVKVLRGQGPLDGADYDPAKPDHQAAVDAGDCFITPHVRMQMRVALMSTDMVLYEEKSPYHHNRFPLTPMWCYRRKRDNAPYGVIRDIRDPQMDYNKRASKALFILSTNQIVMDEGAVEDIEEMRAEAARPDGVMVLQGKGKRFDRIQDKQLAEQHLMLMDRNKAAILDVGGVTNQNLGQDDKGLSGKAIGKLQDQGSIVNTPIFDNRLLALQIQSEIQLSLIEQFYTAEKVVRIVGEKKPVEWLKINQYDQTTGQYTNDVTKSKADYIIDEQDFKASTRQAMFESMMELCSKLPPEVSLQLLDMVIDFADVPNKEEIVNRIRKLNGQNDPSRKPTPQEIQAQQAMQAKKDAAEQMQMETGQAQLALLQTQAKEMEANIKKIVADALKANTTAAYEAMQGAQVVAAAPSVAPIADAILAGAGYVDNQGADPNIPQPEAGAIPPPMPPQQMMPPEDAGMAPPELQQGDGAQAGIETVANDGIQ